MVRLDRGQRCINSILIIDRFQLSFFSDSPHFLFLNVKIEKCSEHRFFIDSDSNFASHLNNIKI